MMEFNEEVVFPKRHAFLTEKDQDAIRSAHVAIAGLGGAGGIQLYTLVRLGMKRFSLADPDTYEVTNLNRQIGATLDTVGKKKVDVSRQMVLSINPTADVRLFPEGINASNIDAFLEGADGVVDGLDFFCIEERLLLYRKAREKGLWVVSVAPLGFGVTVLLFPPKGMRFEDYFDLHDGMTQEEKILSFTFGVSPTSLCLKYMDLSKWNFKGGSAASASVSPAFGLLGGMGATEVMNILLGRYPPLAVPWVQQFDPLLHVYKKRYYRGGMKAPWQRMKRWLLRRVLLKGRLGMG